MASSHLITASVLLKHVNVHLEDADVLLSDVNVHLKAVSKQVSGNEISYRLTGWKARTDNK